MTLAVAVLAHIGIPGPTPFIAFGLFFAAMAAGFGAYFVSGQNPGRRAARIGLGVVAVGCLAAATALPFIIRAGPLFTRPSSRARLEILSPRPNEVITGNPATVDVRLQLVGGKVVALTSIHLIPNEGHIHLYVDGSLVSMTGLDTGLTLPPGEHTVLAEFVAIDHGSFHPRIRASVTFRVRPPP